MDINTNFQLYLEDRGYYNALIEYARENGRDGIREFFDELYDQIANGADNFDGIAGIVFSTILYELDWDGLVRDYADELRNEFPADEDE